VEKGKQRSRGRVTPLSVFLAETENNSSDKGGKMRIINNKKRTALTIGK